jgi:glycosyltransferase involved in cell wall biosynthesis
MSNNKPINILYFSSFGQTGRGGQESLFYLVSKLDRSKFCPHVVVPSEDGLAMRLKMFGIQVSIIKFPKILDWSIKKKILAFIDLIKLIKKNKIEILHTDGPRNTFYAGIVAMLKRIPLIWHVRASNQDRYDRLLYILSSKIILVADALQSRFRINGSDTKFVTIHNGVDLHKFNSHECDKFVRQKYNIANNELLISVTARIEKLKGQKYLIEACGKLKNRIKNFYILLAGDVADFSYLKECQDKAFENGILDQVIFPGQLENISQVLNATDIFVLPSLFEAFPRSIIEAMAAGKPVIATNVGGSSEAFEDRTSGFLVPARDSAALADKIFLLARNRHLREKIGSAARCRVEKMFDIEKKVKETEKLYHEIL